ncbi:hypothetical protein BP6252_10579 [Coleophoma cylindrospora]|uniref:Uncharacterized protein n=1 Tax=Coleophoma cylindrospora TaxID=1849047 RepID=A0A3D8QTB8_9HELO|nr:hypothetical protein BP6252_10579 [Coleophoma cylindrospora]
MEPSQSPSHSDPDEPASDDDGAAAMAAAMGFSSFGTQSHPAKKRKFNSATDAFVDGQELASLDKGGKKGQGSGGNDIPLGKSRVLGVKIEATEGEIDLEEDEQEHEDGGRWLDTSEPAPAEMEAMRRDQERASLAQMNAAGAGHQLPQRPANPPFPTPNAQQPPPPPHQRGQKNQLWYVGYYDPSFNENPWARLEKEHGLEAVGTWLERPVRNEGLARGMGIVGGGGG